MIIFINSAESVKKTLQDILAHSGIEEFKPSTLAKTQFCHCYGTFFCSIYWTSWFFDLKNENSYMNNGKFIPILKFKISLFFQGIISCSYSSYSYLEKEEAKILSHSIDEMAVPFPLPSMPSEENLEHVIEDTNWNSIRRIPTTLVVDSIIFKQIRNMISHQKQNFSIFLFDSLNKMFQDNLLKRN